MPCFFALCYREYGPLQQKVLSVLQRVPLSRGPDGRWEAPSDFMQFVKDAPELADADKNQKKDAMAFASYQMRVFLKLATLKNRTLQTPSPCIP